MKALILMLSAFALTLTGCATNKGLTHLEQIHNTPKAIAILKDKPTRESVLPVLTEWFINNGYSPTVVETLSEVDPEAYVFTYRAWWGWDIALYMRKVQMEVMWKGETLGTLNFDALQYGGFGKFGSGEERLKILLDVLFGKITRETADELLGEA